MQSTCNQLVNDDDDDGDDDDGNGDADGDGGDELTLHSSMCVHG